MEIIPFGKYKGQPIEAMIHDKEYIEWLQKQDWFKNRYQNINAIIINNFNHQNDTPEHNRLQAMFVDNDFIEKFINHLFVLFPKRFPKSNHVGMDLKTISDLNEKGFIETAKFEEDGVDVKLGFLKKIDELNCYYSNGFISIEIKQLLGDDYPGILRQMQANKSEILFSEKFNATTVNLDQIRKMFGEKKIILINDI